MWLFTEFGFFSIVRKPGDSCLTVRARVEADLDALRRYAPGLSETVAGAGTDYPYRACISPEDLGPALAEVVQAIDYGNFKQRVAANQGPGRETVYHRVWRAMMNLGSTVMPGLDGFPWH
jgi:hypothetical protein